MAASMENIFVREFERKNGSSLNISQCSTGDVGCVVWDAALVLMCYLEMPDFHNSAGASSIKEKIILELGSGTGAVGIQAACLGGNVTITDLKEFLPLMDLNIKNNAENITGTVVAKELKWGEDISSFKSPVDILLLADCIYYEESLEPLVQTIEDYQDLRQWFCVVMRREQLAINLCYRKNSFSSSIKHSQLRKFHKKTRPPLSE